MWMLCRQARSGLASPPGDDQPLRAKLGHCVYVQVFYRVADKPVVFPVPFRSGIAFFIFVQRLKRLFAKTVGAETEIFRQERCC